MITVEMKIRKHGGTHVEEVRMDFWGVSVARHTIETLQKHMKSEYERSEGNVFYEGVWFSGNLDHILHMIEKLEVSN